MNEKCLFPNSIWMYFGKNRQYGADKCKANLRLVMKTLITVSNNTDVYKDTE